VKEAHAEVCGRRESGEGIFVLALRTELAREIAAGQFVNVKVAEVEPFLRRPFSVAWCEGDVMELLIQERGRGTKILGQTAPGAALSLLGPLGTPFDLEALAKAPGVDLLAGGVGSAPLILLAAQLRARAPTLSTKAASSMRPARGAWYFPANTMPSTTLPIVMTCLRSPR